MRRELRVVGLVVLGILAVVAGARCQGARDARDTIATRALQDSVRQLQRQVRDERATRDALIDSAVARRAPHLAAQRATDRAAAIARQLTAEARAAAVSDSLELARARRLLVVLADRTDSLLAAFAVERTAGTTRIAALERTVQYVVLTTPTIDALGALQARQARAALARRPWYQRAFGEACTAGLAGTGASVGAVVAAAPGAAIGAIGGYVAGRLSCD